MKRTRRSMALFLGIWLAGSVAAYMASRHSVYAAGGYTDCIPCTKCVYTYNFFTQGSSNKVYGSLLDSTKAPTEVAILGPDLAAGNPTIYTGLSCELFVITGNGLVDGVTYSSCTPDCATNIYPPPQGTYTGSNGQTPSKPFVTAESSWCNSD